MLLYLSSQQKQAYFSRDSKSSLIIIKGRVWNVFKTKETDMQNKNDSTRQGITVLISQNGGGLFMKFYWFLLLLLFWRILYTAGEEEGNQKGFCATWLEHCQRVALIFQK